VAADDKTVGKVRANLEATAEIPQLKTTTGKDGKARPARRHTPEQTPPNPTSPPIEHKPTPRPSPSRLATPDDVAASGPVDALWVTLTEMAERNPAVAQECFEKIVARLRTAMDRAIEADPALVRAYGVEPPPLWRVRVDKREGGK
jgi:hypothetical protein